MIHDKLTNWRMAQVRKGWVAVVTLPLVWSEAFWNAVCGVFGGEVKK